MRPFRRISALLLALLVALCVLPAPAARADAPQTCLTVLFTHDTHDRFFPDAADRGGYARLATLLDRERASAKYPVVTLDAGDFSMGSLLQTVYTTDAPELRTLGALGYDVTTFGNHEYDYRPQGLASMLRAAKASGDPIPAIVQANYNTAKDDSAQVAADAMAEFPVTDYVVLERDGLRIAVFGVLGVDADACAPMSGMVLEPVADAARRVVADIKAKESPDFIICLSHTGTEDGKGEDYELAKAVDGIDLIISGHTHTTLKAPIQVNDTYIVSCGAYTRNLGKITLSRSGGKLSMEEYTLTPLDGSVPSDAGIDALTQRFQEKVDQNYLSLYGFTHDQVLTTSAVDFTEPQVGDLIGEAYIATVREVEGADYVPIAFAVIPDGIIRNVIRAGEVTTANAFDILSLGVGADGTPSYPLLSLYLTGKDLKNAFEVDASVSPLMSGTCLYGAGSWWTYNTNRMFLDKVTDCYLTSPELGDGKTAIQDGQLYRVVADLYSGQMLSSVKAKSFGLLSISPRDAQGNEVEDVETLIIHDADGGEVKAWYALAHYLASAPTVSLPASSKTVVSSWNPVGLLFPMGLPTLIVTVVLLAVLLLLFLLIRWIVRRVRRGRSRRGYTPYQGKK